LSLTAAAQEPTAEYIDQLTARAMERFQVPGIAVGVVKDGELVYAAGHGVRDMRYPDPINVDTIFQIASLTKAFTTAALGILVDEGKIDWEDRVIDHLPQFRMSDPWVTREFTIRDLLTHRSGLGLGAGDLLFWPNQSSTSADVINAMQHLKPETSFRTAYAYDNLLYVIAGEVVGAVAGMPWEDFVETRIMTPLGMDDCRALPDRVVGNENRAVPHMVVDGQLETTFFSGGGPTAAAGAANCNIAGLANWVSMHLAGGALSDGERLLSEDTHKELWQPVTLMPLDDLSREHSRTHFNAYALGWRLEDFFGYLRVGHSGGLQGMTTYIGLLPEKNVAVIVLTNQWSRAYRAISAGVLQSYISDTPKDWVEIYGQAAADVSDDAQREVEEAFLNRDADSKPSLPLDAYVGVYRDPWYGDVMVERSNNNLVMRFGRTDLMVGPLEHFQYDTFIARWHERSLFADAYATFSLGADGNVESIKMRAVSPATDFSFDFHDLDLQRVAD
jgi:CubicO group peptidase (beta-lactamase class C family)